MKLHFAANASFLIELDSGMRILTDPWYSEGIYYGSWYNYPPLSEKQKERFLTSNPDFIYISHLHPDHLDPLVLAKFRKSTPILIGQLPHPHLSRAIRRLGFTDIRELPLGKPVEIQGVTICILPQFEGTGDGTPDDVGYVLDSSLFLKDRNGETLLNAVDNPIKTRDAKAVDEKFGRLDVAILPYSGASFFPHAFPVLSDDEKSRRKNELRESRLKGLVDLANVLKPKWVIPAAGSYVMGGRIARYTRHLHQATPGQLGSFWREHAHARDALKLLTPGDALIVSTGEVQKDTDRRYADFTEEDRMGYAASLAARGMPQDGIVIPSDFVLPWRRLFERARRNLWASQQRLKLFPEADIELCLNPVEGCPVQDAPSAQFRFALDREAPYPDGAPRKDVSGRLFVRFRLDSSLMLMVLVGGAVWNNVEIGALVECERQPDVYTPTIHSLMSFFSL